MSTDEAFPEARRILESFVNNGDPGTVAATVEELSKEVRQAASVNPSAGVANFVFETWEALFNLVGKTPHDRQNNLVDVMAHLRQETVNGADGQALKLHDAKVWADLPTFSWSARDLWNFDFSDADITTERIDAFDNQAAFLARLTALVDLDKPGDPFNYAMYGLWDLRDAFEEGPMDDSDVPRVKHAALWIRYAGKSLQTLATRRSDLPQNTGAAGSRYKGRGWKGFSEDRWEVWKAGFKEAQERFAVADAETKELVDEAVRQM